MEKQKKGLSAFLKKQKQKTSKGAEQPDASPEKEKVDLDSKQAQQEAEQAKKAQEKATTDVKTTRKDDSSDEEEDDLDLNANVRYGKVQEKEEASAAQAEAKAKAQKDFADLELESKAQEQAPKEKAKKTAGNITFGSGVRPSFGNRAKASAIMKDDGGLDDLDDEVKGKKAQKQELARQEQFARNDKKVVMEEPKAPTRPVRPTFKGKLNLTGAGADNADSGVKSQYTFANTYKTEKDEEEKVVAKGKPKPQSYNITGAKAGAFAAAQADMAEDLVDEDGFEVVGSVNDRKTRRQMASMKDAPSDNDFKIVRNEKRGGAFDAMNN